MATTIQQYRKSVTFNMTPMVDVVFLLIIFFLVSSHLAKQETQLEMDLPAADSGAELIDSADRLVVNVLTDGTVMLRGRTVPRGELRQRFTKHLEESGPDLEVRIRSDKSTPFQNVEPVLLRCAQAGIWNVKFAVYRTKDVR